jgi:Flp pilus assembly protein TadG
MPVKRFTSFFDRMLHRRQLTAAQAKRRRLAGQSLVELAIFFPILLMLLSGVVEFGFLLNQYLNLLDGPREAARFAVDISPFRTAVTDAQPAFYTAVAGEVMNAIKPIQLISTRDDVVISIFSVNGSAVARYPTAGHISGESALDNTPGEWHLYGQGGACNPATDQTCHPSTVSNAQVSAWVSQTGGGALPPSMGVVLVEVYYSYPQTLKLPWLTIFIPDPILVHAFTMMPLPAAEPH